MSGEGIGVLEPWFELRSKNISESVSMSFRSMLEKVIKPPLVARERLERDTSVMSVLIPLLCRFRLEFH